MKNESAERDLDTYCKAMARPNGWETCLRIERRYGLDGYPPAVVTTYLAAEVAEEGTGAAAVDKMLGGSEEDDEPPEGAVCDFCGATSCEHINGVSVP